MVAPMKSLVKKLSITLALLAVAVLVVSYSGRQMIESSPVYEASRLEVQKKYGAQPQDLSIGLLRPFKFSDGSTDGHAEFVLCETKACYQISAHKDAGAWQVNVETK